MNNSLCSMPINKLLAHVETLRKEIEASFEDTPNMPLDSEFLTNQSEYSNFALARHLVFRKNRTVNQKKIEEYDQWINELIDAELECEHRIEQLEAFLNSDSEDDWE